MKAATSSMGGRNVAWLWSQCDMEKGAKQTGADSSEKQVEVSLQSKATKPENTG